VISNWAVVTLGVGGALTMINEGMSSVDVIIDVNGYFL
jgi:hypothetical protein